MHRSRGHSRRAFLRSAVALLGVGLGGCTFERRPDREGRSVGRGAAALSGTSAVRVVERPVVASFGEGVRIATPLSVLPAAYVSMATRQVFVDRAHRDRASWLLDAHISVSTWVWRIPLPGDSRRTPIPPGDEAREFEELPIGAWDPDAAPTVGDIRIVLGRVQATTVPLDCVPIQPSDARLSADALVFDAVLPGPGEAAREDFGYLGSGIRLDDPECTDPSGDQAEAGRSRRSVEIFGWAHRG